MAEEPPYDIAIDYAPLRARIDHYYRHGWRDYHGLLAKCFPPRIHAKAWRCSSNGGPPGCAMAFGAAVRRMGLQLEKTNG